MNEQENRDFDTSPRDEICRIAENMAIWNELNEEQRENLILRFSEIWERLKHYIEDVAEALKSFINSVFPVIADMLPALQEIRELIAVCENEKKKERFFGKGKRDIFKNSKKAGFTEPQKSKYRKWRFSVYGHHDKRH